MVLRESLYFFAATRLRLRIALLDKMITGKNVPDPIDAMTDD